MSARRVMARLVRGATGHNTIALPPPVPIFFQRSPAFPSGGALRGIAGLNFEVLINGIVVQAGTTGPNGRADVRVPPGGSSTVRIMVNGASVAEYTVSVSPDALRAANTIEGQKERLRLLGYQIGHAGTDGDGVDATNNMEFERSVLDFQVDNDIFTDGNANAAVQNQLTTQAGA
ncbi:MAG: hypothetical protein SFV54_07135 [Bryobacteraceae bacterium]|nr:hypothetical protein [Bryobacteraceae bacterium]